MLRKAQHYIVFFSYWKILISKANNSQCKLAEAINFPRLTETVSVIHQSNVLHAILDENLSVCLSSHGQPSA